VLIGIVDKGHPVTERERMPVSRSELSTLSSPRSVEIIIPEYHFKTNFIAQIHGLGASEFMLAQNSCQTLFRNPDHQQSPVRDPDSFNIQGVPSL